MFCPNCGSELPDDTKFCTQCGFDLSEVRSRGSDAADASGDGVAESPVPPAGADAAEAPVDGGDGEKSKGSVPKWLVVTAIVLAVVVAGLGAYAIATSMNGRGQTAAQKVVKKPKANGKSGKSAGDAKANVSDKSNSDGADGKSSQTNGSSASANGSDGTNGGSATTSDSAYVVEGEHFRITVPSYWRDKVDVYRGDDEIDVYAKGYKDASGAYNGILAEIRYEDGTDPDVAGDIGYAMMYSQTVGDHHVEVWAPNWPWLVADGYANDNMDNYGLPEQGLRTLIDLSTGGKIGYDQVLQLGENDEQVSMACYNFISSQAWDIQAVGE